MIEILQSPSVFSFPQFDGILKTSTVLFKNLHILYHGMIRFAIYNMHEIRIEIALIVFYDAQKRPMERNPIGRCEPFTVGYLCTE
jgi:hypothetical protein